MVYFTYVDGVVVELSKHNALRHTEKLLLFERTERKKRWTKQTNIL